MTSTTDPCAVPLPIDVPFAFSLQELAVHLKALVDQRTPRGVRYPLVPLLTIASRATLSGHSRVEALADWAALRAGDLAHLFEAVAEFPLVRKA